MTETLGHRLITSQPDAYRGELDRCEEVVVAFVVAGGNCSEVLQFVEEPLDPVSIFVAFCIVRDRRIALRHGGYDRRSALPGDQFPDRVAVVGPVGQ